MARQPCVYILASRRHGTIYIGHTSELTARLPQHRECRSPRFATAGRAPPGSAKRYKVHRLVHFEMFGDMPAAISREKQLKAWRRAWKIALIEEGNPFWEDRAIEFGFESLRSEERRVGKEG